MESKTLNKIQVFAKLGKILSKIVFVCCIIGTVGCIVGITVMAAGETIQIDGKNLSELIETESDLSRGTIYISMIVGLIFCIAETILARLAVKYFDYQLEAGTPFTYEGARQLFRLGIYNICVSVAALTCAGIAYGIVDHFYDNVADLKIDDFESVGLGIVLLFVSLIFKYGAEISENKKLEKTEE